MFSSVFQATIGLAAIVAYALIAASGETMGKWTVTLLLAIAYLVMGIAGLVNWIRNKNQ